MSAPAPAPAPVATRPFEAPGAEFWKYNQRLLKLDTAGRVHFTAEGKATYRPLLARWGFALENVKTREQFREVMLSVNALELEANDAALAEALEHPETTEAERQAVLALLGETAPVPQPAAPCSAAASTAAQVIAVDFRTRR
jgi:hypothetical protein